MELRSLHYFVRIAELGSITRAAAHLHVAQPALTRHVQRLEEELDVALFTRANRGVRLTEAGQKLLDGAARILRDVERTGDEIRAQDAHPSGKIILGITPTLCPVLVPELFARMRRDYPMIELKVMHAGMVRLEEFSIDGRVDLALLSELSRSRLIVSTRLARGGDGAGDAAGRAAARHRHRRRAEPHAADPRRRVARGYGRAARRARRRAEGRDRDQRPRDDPADGAAGRRRVDPAALLGVARMRPRPARGAPHHRGGIFRTLALGVRASRTASPAREAVARTISQLVAEFEAAAQLSLGEDRQTAPRGAVFRWRRSPLDDPRTRNGV